MRITWLVLSAAVACPGSVLAQAAQPASQPPQSAESVAGSLPTVVPVVVEASPAGREFSVSALAPAAWTEDGGGMPAWLKWGLIGGAGTAALAALLSGVSIDADAPGPAESAARGFVIGFVAIGGGVAVYQVICTPGGWSRRNGLCDGPRSRR